jgi:nucleoid DNA-binding protein
VDLSIYIRELLLQHDCVILPDFGGFIANYRSASFKENTNALYPPSKALSFNKNLAHNDGLLISYVSGQKEIGYVDAKRIVTDFINKLKNKLNKGEKVTLDAIGTFFYDNQKNLQFEPDTDSNFHLDSYGLSYFNFSPLEESYVSKRIQRKLREKPPAKAEARRRNLWPVAVAVVILVALLLIPLKGDIFNFKFDISSLNLFKSDKMVEAPDESAIDQKVNDAATISTEEGSFGKNSEEPGPVPGSEPDEPPKEALLPEEPSDLYYLIAGSFKIRDNALSFREKLIQEGYNSSILESKENFYRVSFFVFSNKDEALKTLYTVRQEADKKDVWLLKE